jgi:hypothetical protein
VKMIAIEIDLKIGPFDAIPISDRLGNVVACDVSPVNCNCFGQGESAEGPFDMYFCDQHEALGIAKPAAQLGD